MIFGGVQVNSYIANMPRKGLSTFLEEDERRKEEERFTDEVNFSTETRVNTDKVYKEEFDRDQTFLQKTGDFVKQVLSIPDRLDKAVGIYDTRQSAIKTLTGGLSEDHLVAALAGEMLVPDTIDLITLGLGYIPRRVLLKGPKAIKMFLKFKKSKLPKAAKGSQAMPGATKLADEADYDAMSKAVAKRAGIEGQNVDDALSEAGLDLTVKRDKDGFLENDITPKGDTRNINPDVTIDEKTARRAAQEKYEVSGDLYGNLPKETLTELKKLGLDTEDEIFFLKNYENMTRKGAAAIESMFATTQDFENVKRAALPAFLEAMNNLKNRSGSKTFKKPQLDHVAQLVASLGFFNGRPVKDFPKIAKIIVEEGVYGLGHDKKNLEMLFFDVHTVKTNFWRDTVGGAGEKFFSDGKGGYKVFKTDTSLRNAAKQYARIIRESDRIVGIANDQFKLMNAGDEVPQEVLEELMQRVTLTDLRKKYNIKQVRAIMDEILKDTKTLAGFSADLRSSFGKGYNKQLNALIRFIRKEDRARTILLDVAQNNLTYNQATQKYLKMGITQLEFEGMAKLVKQKGVKTKLRNLSKGIRRQGQYTSAKEIDEKFGNAIGSGGDV